MLRLVAILSPVYLINSKHKIIASNPCQTEWPVYRGGRTYSACESCFRLFTSKSINIDTQLIGVRQV